MDNANKYLIPKVLTEPVIKKKIISNIFDINKFNDFTIDKREKRSRAFLSIQDGCDFRCTFCIIPFARGKSRSMETSSVIDKINEFSNLGYNEVVLSGIHLSSYGNDIDSNLLELLKLIETYCQITNIRLSSIDPADTSKELIDFFSNSKKICPSFHISLQSGSSEILKSMKRRYRLEKFDDILDLIKKNNDSSCIGTDVIAGFPGETEYLFNKSYEYLEGAQLDYFHVFPYSDRRGTKASSRKDKVDNDLKKERSKALRGLSDKKKMKFYKRFIGKKLTGISEKNSHARTRNYIDVNIKNNPNIKNGEVVELVIDKVENGRAFGIYV